MVTECIAFIRANYEKFFQLEPFNTNLKLTLHRRTSTAKKFSDLLPLLDKREREFILFSSQPLSHIRDRETMTLFF